MNSCLKAHPAPQQAIKLKKIECAGGAIYPNLYKWLYTGWQHGHKLQTVIDMITAIDHPIFKDGKPYTSLSIRQIQRTHGGGGLDTWHKYLKAFVSWGLLEQYTPQNTRGSIQAERNAIKYAKEQAHKYHLQSEYYNPTQWYHLPEYTEELLIEADRKAGGYIPSITKADWIINAGQKEADRLFNDKRGISKKRKRTQEQIETALVACLSEQGYATDEGIIASVETSTGFNKRYITNTLKGQRKDLKERYDLTWKRPSKKQVQENKLKSYAYIYIQGDK